MTEAMYLEHLRQEGRDPDEIEELVGKLVDRQCDEQRDRELEDQHIMKLAEYYVPY
jgi:hypothetical protein